MTTSNSKLAKLFILISKGDNIDTTKLADSLQFLKAIQNQQQVHRTIYSIILLQDSSYCLVESIMPLNTDECQKHPELSVYLESYNYMAKRCPKNMYSEDLESFLLSTCNIDTFPKELLATPKDTVKIIDKLEYEYFKFDIFYSVHKRYTRVVRLVKKETDYSEDKIIDASILRGFISFADKDQIVSVKYTTEENYKKFTPTSIRDSNDDQVKIIQDYILSSDIYDFTVTSGRSTIESAKEDNDENLSYKFKFHNTKSGQTVDIYTSTTSTPLYRFNPSNLNKIEYKLSIKLTTLEEFTTILNTYGIALYKINE